MTPATLTTTLTDHRNYWLAAGIGPAHLMRSHRPWTTLVPAPQQLVQDRRPIILALSEGASPLPQWARSVLTEPAATLKSP